MNQFILRFWIFVVALLFTKSAAQNYGEGLSDATLTVNYKELPVKLFSTTNLMNLQEFSGTTEKNVVMIVNEDNFEMANPNTIQGQRKNDYIRGILDAYTLNGFKFADKNLKVSEGPVPLENMENVKYLIKTEGGVKSADQLEFSTPFKIWDPSKGIKLGSFTLHFYSLMFIFAFGLGFLLMSKMFKIDNVDAKYLDPLFTWTLIGTILGARLGHVIFYEPSLFKEDFWSVFLPIQTKPEFKFTGFAGLASHGASIMLIFTTLYYSFKIIKKNPLWVYDRLGIVVALGGAFVRLGNFFNSEIIGKATDPNSPFAVFFPQMSSEYGLTVPRYPAQLFEAIGYVLLFVLLWILYRYTNKKYQQGWLFGLFFVILWCIRFFVEYLKEPQGNEIISFAGLNTGQILSIPFIIAGLVIMIISKKFKLKEPETI